MSKIFEQKDWQESMKLRFDFNNMMTAYVGENGINESEIADLEAQIEKAEKAMVEKRTNGGMDWRELPYNQAEVVSDIKSYVESVKDDFDAFVVLGIGGSALGPIAVQQAINHPYYNELSKEKRGGYPKLYVMDNVDPEKLVSLFNIIDLDKTLFNVITKSGSTSETMSQFMIIKEMLEEKLGKEESKKHIVCTTDVKNGNLRPIADTEGYKSFVIPAGVGGRFSELTPVGLLPAAMCGIDIEELLAGAAYMDEMCKTDNTFKNPASMYAILNYISMKKGKNISVIMPYADSLKYIGDWYAQLWAESLGKKYDNDKNVVNSGQTPVRALGATDQHSQVQLYSEGPKDKVIVFVGVDKYKTSLDIPKIYGDIPSLGFLGGETHNKLIKTEQMATEYALLKSGQTNMTITLPEVNEFTLGQILYLFEVATGFAGELLNINAFDQPGVEEGKNATYAMFGRPGYDEKKAELDKRPAKNDKYII
ncbi:glucose-6-phosphate isomerase [Vallitalea longa]|uniref:Glucose-6-phosphate isomerase n=1 Tax=Vallitalea longa TaxID=2936439 RepID=A0A9W5YF01_9FIRM|nr:glucose-6-phosphate isomerase [Vallitalea longa]GKX31844.1 glucose-6-phosphate isomerase [Vallitalea longa]